MVLKKQKDETYDEEHSKYIHDLEYEEYEVRDHDILIQVNEFERMCQDEDRYQHIVEITNLLKNYIDYQILPFGDKLDSDDIENFLKNCIMN